jgi:methionyl-tRNA formyltransferase
LKTARGAAINQHAGHSPEYKGSHTILWPLYHRRLEYVSNTVHITRSGADSGPILRRSNPCLFKDDTPASIMSRSVALGTELMIEVVREIINHKQLPVFNQSIHTGKTYLGAEADRSVRESIIRDFQQGWLDMALQKQRQF